MPETTPPKSLFDDVYAGGAAPWVIGEPQPAIVDLERRGAISGAVLDAGCGAGEHTILLTGLGYDLLGVDFSARAVELARATAAARGVNARFEVADATRLDGEPRFDTVVDSALFQCSTTSTDGATWRAWPRCAVPAPPFTSWRSPTPAGIRTAGQRGRHPHRVHRRLAGRIGRDHHLPRCGRPCARRCAGAAGRRARRRTRLAGARAAQLSCAQSIWS